MSTGSVNVLLGEKWEGGGIIDLSQIMPIFIGYILLYSVET